MLLKEIYHSHKDMVYNLALQYVQNTEDAEEITQDVFVKVFQKIEGFKNLSGLKTWIYRITINQSLDFIKARKSKKRWAFFSALSIDKEGQDLGLSDFNHPGVALEQKNEVSRILNCVNQLSENQKTVIILLKIEQVSPAQAAEILNISTKAVESLFQRAKKNLSELLNQNEEK
jgi:RNA polymerase sigma factor (sigma-70 family)